MPIDVSPTALAEIRMGEGPAGRTPKTVMEVRRVVKSQHPSWRNFLPILVGNQDPRTNN